MWLKNFVVQIITMSLGILMIQGCVSVPKGVAVVQGFHLERYLGTWYEIARLDNRFERGLSDVSATYQKRDDGGIDVFNRGFSKESNDWKEVRGRAYKVGKPGQASLKVTFFWPFYAGYNVIVLDRDNYQYALVCGPSKKYLWILAREKQLEESIVNQLLAKAKAYGFKTDELIFVTHVN
ncbi:MAG: lipocalin [Desulfuromonas sp.]|nr:MAG: lipocalin [Desulfuromonas sp.]